MVVAQAVRIAQGKILITGDQARTKPEDLSDRNQYVLETPAMPTAEQRRTCASIVTLPILGAECGLV